MVSLSLVKGKPMGPSLYLWFVLFDLLKATDDMLFRLSHVYAGQSMHSRPKRTILKKACWHPVI